MQTKTKTGANRVTGLTMILVNVYWIWDNLHILYLYHSTDILFLFIFPDWTLIISALAGLSGIFFSIKVLIGRLRISDGIIFNSLALLTAGVLKIIAV